MKRYYVYRNLHKNCFSIMYNGLVIDHSTHIVLKNAVFKVSEIGQAKVRSEKRKNVHAKIGAESYVTSQADFDSTGHEEIYYDPYTTDTFIMKSSGLEVTEFDTVVCSNNKVYVCSMN